VTLNRPTQKLVDLYQRSVTTITSLVMISLYLRSETLSAEVICPAVRPIT